MDYRVLDETVVVRDDIKLWEQSDSAWAVWMNRSYVKARPLDAFYPKQGDSNGWKALLKAKGNISKCVRLSVNGLIDWLGAGGKPSSHNIFQTI